MRSLNLILLLLGTLSLLMLGTVPASTMAGTAAPPCHEAVASQPVHDEAPVPSGQPGKAVAAMACCVSCVVAPAPQSPEHGLTARPQTPAAPAPATLPVGLSPAPEHGPPKA